MNNDYIIKLLATKTKYLKCMHLDLLYYSTSLAIMLLMVAYVSSEAYLNKNGFTLVIRVILQISPED